MEIVHITAYLAFAVHTSFFFFSYYEPIIFTIFLLYYLQKYLCARTYIFITTLTFNDGEIKKKNLSYTNVYIQRRPSDS